MSLGKKSVFSPFTFWLNIFKNPTTVRFPKEEIDTFDRPGASPSYRGLHINDLELCIGCGTCEEICPTAAITMIEGENVGEGKLGKKPKIDYGRCCFCGFCVDMCPSRSLNMSRTYIRTYRTRPDTFGEDEVRDIGENFKYIPGDDFSDNAGYITPDELSWLDLERIEMQEISPKKRLDSFIEIVKGFTQTEAIKEASRCIECGVCKETCPAGMNIPEYIRAIWDDDLEESVKQMYEDNPLPNVCGRICTHRCEEVCSLGHRGEPIAIRWLKRYAVDNLEPESIQNISRAFAPSDKKRKVSIIGSGPSGLSAAYYLAMMGYQVNVFEEREKAGGIMRYGVPKYRLPDSALDRDIDVIRNMGVQIRTKTKVGKDIPLAKIRKESDAVFIATGFSNPRSTGIPGIAEKGCFQALDLLEKIAKKKDFFVGKRIVVIGGGNVAFDIARSLVRLQRVKFGKIDLTLTCLEDWDEMPADQEEIEDGQKEGILIKPARSPKEVVFDENLKIKGLATVKCTRVFDENMRFDPQVDESDKEFYGADMVIEAIGQAPDYSYLEGESMDKLEFVRGKIITDEDGGTDVPWLFAGGDIVHGPDAIHAIADGHRSAKAIDEYLMKQRKLNKR